MSEIIHRQCTCEHLQIDHDWWGGGNCTQCDCEKFNEDIDMSIASDIAAEHSESKRKEWLAKLEVAYAEKDWGKVKLLIEEIQRFYF